MLIVTESVILMTLVMSHDKYYMLLTVITNDTCRESWQVLLVTDNSEFLAISDDICQSNSH